MNVPTFELSAVGFPNFHAVVEFDDNISRRGAVAVVEAV